MPELRPAPITDRAVRRPHGLTRFATSGIPDERRIPLWEQHNARSLVGLRAQTLGDAPFQGVELNLNLPTLHLARVRGTPHVVERDHRQIAEHPAEGVVAYFILRGTGHFNHRGGREALSAGQGILCDVDQPFSRDLSAGVDELAVKFPRTTLKELTGTSNLAGPRVFSFRGTAPDATHAGALAQTVGGAMSGDLLEWDALEQRVVDLLGHMLGNAGSPAGHVSAAEVFIASHFATPGLSAGRLAAAVGISERQLSRLFADSGRSVPQAILEARLQAAREFMASPDHASTPLSEVAARHGFASQEYFTRSYRAHFSTTPLRDRKELLAAAGF
ncbi:helix-turn-helix domain-containing protein [Pseudarthrobacter sp. H2]|uniref:helix-turn-helix domain-containing protein n=1 Tax=Pseudarthrobacter sp. H2 TaxID=3418415 RepID=UPI003CF20C43